MVSTWNKLRIRLEHIIDDLRALPMASFPVSVRNQLVKVTHAIMWVSRSYPDNLDVQIFIEDALSHIEYLFDIAQLDAAIPDTEVGVLSNLTRIFDDFCKAEDAYNEEWRQATV